LLRVAPRPFRDLLSTPLSVGRGHVEPVRPFWLVPAQDSQHICLSPAGDDDAPGLPDEPIRTLAKAFERPEPVVILAPGVYEPAELHGSAKRLVAPQGGVILRSSGPHLAGQIFRHEAAGLWRTRLMLRHETTIIRLLHPQAGADGHEIRLRKHPTPIGLMAGQDGWHLDRVTGDLTVRCNVPPHTLRAIYSDAGGTSALTVINGQLMINGDVTLDGVAVYARGGLATLALRSCSIQFTDGPGVRVEDGNCCSEAVNIYAPTADGFSYAGRGFGTEINCRSIAAGDVAHEIPAIENCNASSAHGEYVIARFGGVYERSYGPDIADQGEGETTGYTWNVGVITRGSLVDIGMGLYVKRVGWFDTCSTEGEFRVEHAAARTFNCRFGRTVLFAGQSDAYDPANP
jgi:hypothetical protein